jgi:hypothetical protein
MNIINATENIYEMEGNRGKLKRQLIHHKGEFYVVSENTLLEETLVFKATPTGDVESYCEVGGGKGVTLEEVLGDLDEWLYDEDTEDL